MRASRTPRAATGGVPVSSGALTDNGRTDGHADGHRDGLAELARTHRALDQRLTAQVEDPQPAAGRQVLVTLVTHEVVSHGLLDPPTLAHLPGGDQLVRRLSAQQRGVLRAAEGVRAAIGRSAPAPDDEVTAAWADLHWRFSEHADREEIERFPGLRRALTATDRARLAERYRVAMTQIVVRCTPALSDRRPLAEQVRSASDRLASPSGDGEQVDGAISVQPPPAATGHATTRRR